MLGRSESLTLTALVAALACPAPPALATLGDPNARPRGMMREEAFTPSDSYYLHNVVPPRARLRPIAVDAVDARLFSEMVTCHVARRPDRPGDAMLRSSEQNLRDRGASEIE